MFLYIFVFMTIFSILSMFFDIGKDTLDYLEYIIFRIIVWVASLSDDQSDVNLSPIIEDTLSPTLNDTQVVEALDAAIECSTKVVFESGCDIASSEASFYLFAGSFLFFTTILIVSSLSNSPGPTSLNYAIDCVDLRKIFDIERYYPVVQENAVTNTVADGSLTWVGYIYSFFC